MVTAWPAKFPGLATAADRLAKRITLLSGGTLAVKVFAAGELVPAFGSFDAVAEGKAEMYHAMEAYWEGKSPAFTFFTAVPFGLTAQEMAAWIYQGGGQELWDELSLGFKLKPFMAGNTGTQMGGWFKNPVASVDDFKGLRIAVTGLGARVLRQIGAAPVILAGREIPAALKDGTIGAAEWFGPWHGRVLGLHEAASNFYYPGIYTPGMTLSLGVNLAFWESLTLSQKEAIETASAAETVATLAEFEAANANAIDALRRESAIEPKRLPDKVLNALGQAAGMVVAEAAAADPAAKKIHEAFLAFRQQAVAWSRLSLQAYLDARLLPFRYVR